MRKIIYENPRLYYLAKVVKGVLSGQLSPGLTHHEAEIMVCGMNRSGSTLLYNILGEILKEQPVAKVGFVYGGADHQQSLRERRYLTLRKTHAFTLLLKRRIASGATLAFFSYRNLLDVIASHRQKGWIEDVEAFVESGRLDQVVSEAILFRQTHNVILVDYRRLMADKEGLVAELASRLNIDLTAEQVNTIVASVSLESVKKKMSAMQFDERGQNKVNEQSGLHHNHINDPSENKYRTVLSEKEVALIKGTKAYARFEAAFYGALIPSPRFNPPA